VSSNSPHTGCEHDENLRQPRISILLTGGEVHLPDLAAKNRASNIEESAFNFVMTRVKVIGFCLVAVLRRRAMFCADGNLGIG